LGAKRRCLKASETEAAASTAKIFQKVKNNDCNLAY
jgi:hypothetical protein